MIDDPSHESVEFVIKASRTTKLIAAALSVSAVIGTFGLVSYARDAANRAQENVEEQRCQAIAAADVSEASAALQVTIADGLAYIIAADRASLASLKDELHDRSVVLDKAVRVQQAAQEACR